MYSMTVKKHLVVPQVTAIMVVPNFEVTILTAIAATVATTFPPVNKECTHAECGTQMEDNKISTWAFIHLVSMVRKTTN